MSDIEKPDYRLLFKATTDLAKVWPDYLRKHPYPVTIVANRYGGALSYGGRYWALSCEYDEVPTDVNSGDMEAYNFIHNNRDIVGTGDTPDEAWKDLKKKLGIKS